MRALPLLLAAVLATTAIVALLATLLSSVRGRRREFGVLRVLGLTTRQVRYAVAVQALMIAAVAVGIGIPIGIVAGRVSWTRFAEEVGAVPRPVIPLGLLLGSAALTVAVGALLAVLPGRIAARTATAAVLRTE